MEWNEVWSALANGNWGMAFKVILSGLAGKINLSYFNCPLRHRLSLTIILLLCCNI